jgi:S-DNA-T family DNA segregation ATPase FtsK/SpoIIIE
VSDSVYPFRARSGPTAPPKTGSQDQTALTDPAADLDHESVTVEKPVAGPGVDPPDRKLPVTHLLGTKASPKPILPPWLRSRSDAFALLKWSARYGVHVAAYHSTRSPKYAAKVGMWAPIGLVRAVWLPIRWAMAEEGNWGLRQYAANVNDPATWLALDRQRQRESVWRWWVIAGGAIATVAGVWALTRAPAWGQVAFLAVTLPILATLGRPADRPITDRVIDGPRYKKLTAELVRRALCSIGLAGINQAVAKDPGAISFPAEIIRDGPGYRAVVDLPYGVDAAEVVARRPRLASGLRLPHDQVWPAPESGHRGRLELYVGDEPASKMKQPPWPLLSLKAKVDIFKSFPFATDPRQRTITGALMERNWLIGAMPGAGKTFALRLCLLAAALDHRVDLRGYELKGTGDLDMLEDLCTEFGSGIDDATIGRALDMLRRLYAECERRGPIVKRMAKAGKSDENKITPELAGMVGLNLRPLVAFIDECQNLFAHPEFGKEAGELAEKVIKLGRALGIILLLATQRPDKDSLPKGISANAGVRFCLRVTGQVENDMILGTSMYKQGIRATEFEDTDYGWGWLIGLGKRTACKSFYVDGPSARRVVVRATELRRAAGTLPDDLGPLPAVASYDLLADVLAVWPAGDDRVWNETLLERLTGLRPEVYTGWKPDQLTSALKPHSVGTDQIGRRIDGVTVNRRGPARVDVEAAVTARNRNRPVGSLS